MLRLHDRILGDPAMLGLYAENLVFNAVARCRGILDIDYFRQDGREIDFVVHTGPGTYWPIEVKYQRDLKPARRKPFRTLQKFAREHVCAGPPLVVTRDPAPLGFADEARERDSLFFLPLSQLLLMLD